jgi:hypothetical protein
LTGGQFSSGINDLLSVTYGGFMMLDADLKKVDGDLIGLGNSGSGSGTNGLGIYSTNANVYPGLGNGTNAGLGTGSGALGAADSTVATFTNGLGSAPSVGAGSAAVFSFAFCGTTLNLDPESIFPGMPSIIRQLMGWGETVAFMLWFGKQYLRVSGIFATAQTGGVPDLEASVAGFGGNLLGYTAALVVPFVYIGLWVGVFTYIFSVALGYETSSYFTTNPFTGMGSFTTGSSATGAGALYLLNDFFPVPYTLSLLWTTMLLLVTMTKFVVVCSATSRFLFGK